MLNEISSATGAQQKMTRAMNKNYVTPSLKFLRAMWESLLLYYMNYLIHKCSLINFQMFDLTFTVFMYVVEDKNGCTIRCVTARAMELLTIYSRIGEFERVMCALK